MGTGDTSQRPRVVCLCGSTRFFDAFQRANFAETMAGRIVLSVAVYLANAYRAMCVAQGTDPGHGACRHGGFG